ncbi:ketosteroid isomerase family protein [Mycobacterium sp. SMC-4]|uniref:ketosteroid isomerase family protein n=1 Tax=Mycobacterium sp. SMC-4 TaxID=2857059 RepID=UPI0021B233A3|nr:ketosteroid isomerase family protein [Mycobacterium sp. SMC-4]UXA15886.1 ketosteroid isomerase family protein [Mycobacterium sp. SMC-4]
MATTRSDLLTAAQRSLTAANAHDREGWIGLFTDDGRVEDPVGSAPHRGRAAIARFYDTFIGPRTINFHPHADIVSGTTVVRDVTLEIAMSSALTMQVQTFIRYDLREVDGAWRLAALTAYWELPAMMRQFARGGLAALPAGAALGRTMLTNQGLLGSLGFAGGFFGLGSAGKNLFANFLDAACSGDEVGLRRVTAGTSLTRGDNGPVTSSELAAELAGAHWDKLITSGRSVAARLERDGIDGVMFGQVRGRVGHERAALSRLCWFTDER